jgi:hypothetical protein
MINEIDVSKINFETYKEYYENILKFSDDKIIKMEDGVLLALTK